MEIGRLRAVQSQYSIKIREAKADDEDRIVKKLRDEMRTVRQERGVMIWCSCPGNSPPLQSESFTYP